MIDSPDPALVVNSTALKFLGEWHRLVSSTNWEKGRIISQWKTAMSVAGAHPREASDEVWAVQVGQVSPQHVGRLRRAWERFGKRHRNFPGLYWSHFGAVLEWEDADDWLRKASEERLSVAQMRNARWESQGRPDPRPSDSGVNLVDDDGDADVRLREDLPVHVSEGEAWDVLREEDRQAAFQASRRVDETVVDQDQSFQDTVVETGPSPLAVMPGAPTAVRPFENLPELPGDFSEAFEAFKLAIVRQRLAGWSAVRPEAVTAALESLLVLVESPLEQEA